MSPKKEYRGKIFACRSFKLGGQDFIVRWEKESSRCCFPAYEIFASSCPGKQQGFFYMLLTFNGKSRRADDRQKIF